MSKSPYKFSQLGMTRILYCIIHSCAVTANSLVSYNIRQAFQRALRKHELGLLSQDGRYRRPKSTFSTHCCANSSGVNPSILCCSYANNSLIFWYAYIYFKHYCFALITFPVRYSSVVSFASPSIFKPIKILEIFYHSMPSYLVHLS